MEGFVRRDNLRLLRRPDFVGTPRNDKTVHVIAKAEIDDEM